MKNMPEQKEKGSWDKYKVALISAVVVLDILLAAIFLTGSDDEKLPAEKNQSQEVQPTVTIEVPAQIVQVPQSDSTPPANVSNLNPADGYPSGQYKIGSDIPAGEYKMALESGGHFSVYGNAHDRNILANGFTNNPETRYVKLSDGQYFQLKKGTATKVK